VGIFKDANSNKKKNMYKELEKFKDDILQDDSLEQTVMLRRKRCVLVCSSRRKELIMVGSTGTVQNDGTLKN
jgi:hypothetical protein